MDLIELNPFPSVTAGGQFALTTDEIIDASILGLIFDNEGSGTLTKAQIEDIEIKMQKPLIEGINGDALQEINNYDGFPDNTGMLYHWFGDPLARTIRGQWKGALDTSVYRGAPLEIRGKINAAAITPALKVWAIVGPAKLQMGLGFDEVDAATVRAFVRTLVQPSGAVSNAAYNIGLGSEAGARVRKLHFRHTGNLTHVEFRKHNEVKWEKIRTALNTSVLDQFARTAQANMYTLDRIMDGNQGEAETTLMDDGRPWPYQVKLTTSAADTINVFADLHTAIPLL